MEVIQVVDKEQQQAFLDVARKVYEKDPIWVCPLDMDIQSVFDQAVNPFYQHGEANRWILKNEKGQLIGRIAAFINEKKANYKGNRYGGIGFFECIDDTPAAQLLFDTAVEWLLERKVTHVEAPINFAENDQFWGLLVEGFTQPSYGMAYNPSYYQSLFESYGFQKKLEQITNEFNLEKGLSPRFVKIAKYVKERRTNVTTESIDLKKIDKYASDFLSIYNSAWKEFENFTPITKDYVMETMRKIEPILDPGIVRFAYVNGDPAAFVLCLPDVNQIFKRFKGKLNLWNKLRFLILKKMKIITKVRVVVMGSKPEYQRMGLESVLTYENFNHVMENTNVRDIELSWVGDFNEKMLAIHKGLGAEPSKKHFTYVKEIA